MERARYGLIEDANTGVDDAGLLICYHGLGGSPRQLAKHSGLGALTRKYPLRVVFAKSLWRFWRFWGDADQWHMERDLATFDEAWADVCRPRKLPAYPPLFVLGYSAGANFAMRLCELRGNQMDGAIIVAGQMKAMPSPMALQKPVPPALFVGADGDRVVKPSENALVMRTFWPTEAEAKVVHARNHLWVPEITEAVDEWIGRRLAAIAPTPGIPQKPKPPVGPLMGYDWQGI